eukprot:1973940-Pleurochrysis_carterae.AAC.1
MARFAPELREAMVGVLVLRNSATACCQREVRFLASTFKYYFKFAHELLTCRLVVLLEIFYGFHVVEDFKGRSCPLLPPTCPLSLTFSAPGALRCPLLQCCRRTSPPAMCAVPHLRRA